MLKLTRSLTLLALGTILLATAAQAQSSDEAKNVLRRSREKCQSIQQGHYVMERKMKFMSGKDTTAERHTCDFRKLPDDTIYGKAFNMTFESMDEGADWKGHILYTGREQVWIYDTAAVIGSHAADKAFVFVYSPEAGAGILDQSAVRGDHAVHVSVPTYWNGHRVHVYGFAKGASENDLFAGVTSDSRYLGSGTIS